MPTYRTQLARPTTPPPAYDWSETVVASDQNTAISRSWADWNNDKPNPAVPPLSQCRTECNPATQTVRALAASSAITPGQQAFINDIQNQVATLLATKLDGVFNAVIYPSGFNYGITYGANAYYNQATLQDIDTLLSTASNGQLELSGADFSALYVQIMQGVVFSFSQADQAMMNQQDTAASAQIASVLTEFTNAGGVYSNPLPFGGELQDVFNQLTKQFGSLSNLPDTLNALRNAIASYKSIAGNSYVLHNRYFAATARIAAALANAQSPSATNGGQQVSPTGYYVGYTPNKLPTANYLIGELATASNAINIKINLSNFNSSSTQMSISGGGGFSIPILDVIGISINASAQYNMSRYTSSSSSVTMTMNYPGVTLFSAMPTALSSDNTTGWYALDILQEVVAKTGQDITGYKLVGSEYDVNTLFGVGMTFSRLKTFVISQQPTITMTFSGSDSSQLLTDFQANASASVSLFGIFTLGSVAGSYKVQNVTQDSQAGTVTVTFGPPQVSGTIPLQQQVAYVIGGVASYPPNAI